MVNFIGDIGYNHNGDLKAMKMLMKLGSEAGFKFIKFRISEKLNFDMFDIHEIFDYANELNIKLYSAIDDYGMADYLAPYTDVCEIPLERNNDKDFINYIMKIFPVVIFSVDSLDYDYLENIYYSYAPTIFLFNATEDNCNTKDIRRIKEMNNMFFGFKYNNDDIIPHIVAITNGCHSIERSITLCKNLKGDNHKNSLEPDGYEEFIEKLRFAKSLC